MDIVPYTLSFIGSYLGLYSYYLYSSYQFIRIPSEMYIFYVNSVVTLTPAIVYSYNIINISTNRFPIDSFILQNFFIEWSITTPLILVNIRNLSRFNLTNQLMICICSSIMNIFGFLSNNVRDEILFFVFYSLGILCLVIIFAYMSYVYYTNNWIFIDNKKGTKFVNSMIYIVVSTWSIYPVIFILYKYNLLNIENTVISFMCLDFLSKGLFMMKLIRHQELLYINDSFTRQTKTSFLRIGKSEKVIPVVDESPGNVTIITIPTT